MDGGGDNQLSLRSFRSRSQPPAARLYNAGAPRESHAGPDPAQGEAVALQRAFQAMIAAELSEDSGFESDSESG
ncbi:hypothetical protein M5D96_010014 [Drosophila gunungcola]|uniref:Uncharacterized protein n=1 Tax=Drosophila gunungcola TaxID=103775 RepID=A0A9P9YHW8_9MUSC|nr:hypothetical protein M5D96_010014 [Drosophila gunungcola]